MASKARNESSALAQTHSARLVVAASKNAKELNAKLKSKKADVTEHTLDLDACFQMHKTQLGGLSTAQADAVRQTSGLNILTPPPERPTWLKFMDHMVGFFSLLLWFAAILCFFAYIISGFSDDSNLYLGVVLSIVVFATGIFSFWQEAKSDAVMAGFATFLPEFCQAIRDGEATDIEAKFLVPGDIVNVIMGDKIPADVRVITDSDFKCDNSSLTGESEPVKRTSKKVSLEADGSVPTVMEATNVAFYGTMCVNGKCKGLIIRTGDNTVIGQIANLASSTDNSQTPINLEIEHFIKIVSYVAVFLGMSFLIIGFIIGVDPIGNLVFAIGIIVANVPEGLLATVTVSLTLTAKRMAEKKVLVKALEAVETLGSTTVIASDKTGTLTQNRMTCSHLWYDMKIHNASPHPQEREDYPLFQKEQETFHKLMQIATLCNTATFKVNAKNMALPILQRECNGDASESAFIKFCEPVWRSQGVEGVVGYRDSNMNIHSIPFNSANKYQVSINLQTPSEDNKTERLLLMKGAPERVWNRCDRILVDGKEQKITEEVKAKFDADIAELMFKGERVLGFCYTPLECSDYPADYPYSQEEPNFPMGENPSKEDLAEFTGLRERALKKQVFVGLMSLVDPPRPAVPDAVALCQRAGIRVVMVTGDHPATAEAIAKQVGIIKGYTVRDVARKRGVPVSEINEETEMDITARVVKGGDLEYYSPEQLDRVLDYEEIVFARTSPKQKLIIVNALQNKTVQRPTGRVVGKALKDKPCKHIVAVTGDGVNDSPALKAADIGIAMGLTGTQVAKQAADMILLNDNFASIVDGVEEGRLIFDNLKKSIAYTLSSNIPEISPFLVFIILQIPLPLPTVLILCIDLGTDMIPAISLAYENKEANIMEKPPRDSRKDRLVTTKMISFSYLQVGIIQALAGFFTYIVVLNDYGFHPSVLIGAAFAFDDGKVVCVANDQFSPVDNATPDGNGFDGCEPTVANPELDGKVHILYDEGSNVPMQDCTHWREGVCWDREEALAHAQASFFISIIVVQWSDIIACKTRWLSLKQQGMRNGMLNFGLFFETALGLLLSYVPALEILGTRPLLFVHWLPAVPFAILITLYDETRKWLMRNLGKGNWVYENTYY